MFVVLGSAGLVWVVLWLLVYRDPPQSTLKPAPASDAGGGWKLIRDPRLKGVLLARLVADPVWYAMLFWLPAFLREQQGLSLAMLGALGWIPFLVADVGGIGSSAAADAMIRRGNDPVLSRVKVLNIAAFLGPLIVLLALPLTTLTAIAVFSIVGAVCLTWFFGTAALLGDLLPQNQVAGALGWVGAAGALGGLVVNALIGPAIGLLGFGGTFGLLALSHPIAIWILKRNLQRHRTPRVEQS